MEDSREKLIKLCLSSLESKGLNNDKFRDRLKLEIKEIDNQAEHDYFIDLHNKKVKFSKNENNLLVPYILGLTNEFDPEQEPVCVQGEFPDIDVDYLPIVQEYLRKEWCPKKFGRDNVVNIGNYATFGIKSALLDMARVHGANYQEIQSITKNLQDRDEEGKPITWEKALEITPELNEYCKNNPEIADAAQRLIDRNRGRGKHAGGTVISSIKIDDLVPIMTDTDGNPVSGWTEGLHDQDLQPVGLIKFDVLAVKDLLRIANCCYHIKQRHPEIKSIAAIAGQSDWTDTSYLNDPLALELADRAETRGIFQFDGEGMRNLIRAGGVTSFDDLVAYSSLFRPGPLGMKMHERYTERKRGREEWEDQIPICLKDVLGNTYGVLCYQEQVMKVLNIVGDIPLIHCEKIRKAISKKKTSEFVKYKQMFMENGSRKTGWPLDSDDNRNMRFLWDQIESFASYGFNKSVDENTYIPTPNGLKKIRNFQKGDKVYCVNESGRTVETEVVNIHDHGSLDCYSVVFDDGHEVVCTLDHKFLTQQGQVPLHEILAKDISVFCERQKGDNYAKEEEQRMGGEVRGYFCDKKDNGETSDILSEMRRVMLQDWRVEGSLRQMFSSEMSTKPTPTKMSGMSKFGLGREDMDCQMSDKFSDFGENERTPQDMQEVQENKTSEYKGKESKDKSIERSPCRSLNCRKKDLGSPGDSSRESSPSKKMEGGESGKVQEMYPSSTEKPQKIKDGRMAAETTRVEDETNSLWNGEKTGGFCEEKNLDRDRRFLSFSRTPKQGRKRRFKTPHCSAEGRHAEQGMFEEKEHYAYKGGYVVFPQQHRTNGLGVVDFVSEHAPISETGNLVSRKIVRAVPVGRRQCYDLEVACSTHNFILPNGVITSNSHAVAYTYTSARLLYLKAHYPLEFFCSTLALEADEDKVKIYKREAERMGIKINRCDLNKSKVNYEIIGDEIYVGFSNIKGIGQEVAENIVASQPYSGISDFLERIGTDKRIVEPLINLGVFKDASPNILTEFYEDFKKWTKGNQDKEKRQNKRREELLDVINSMLEKKDILSHELIMDCYKEGDASRFKSYILKSFTEHDVFAIIKKYAKSVLDFEHKNNFNKNNSISLENWTCNNRYSMEKWPSIFEIERKHYGFSWEHPIQKSSDYIGNHSFNIFKEDDTIINAGVEVVVVKKPQEKMSKKDNKYYFLLVEDEDWNVEVVTFWSEDYARFKEELEYWNEEQNRGNFLRIRVTRPGPGFKSYTFESPPKAVRHKVIPADKKNDVRLQIMESPM